MLAMATHGKGKDNQVALLTTATRSKCNVRKVSGALGECKDRQILGKCNGGRIASPCSKGYIEGSSPGTEGCSAAEVKPLPPLVG